MFTRILTTRERKLIHAYLSKNGERISAVRQLAYRARRDLTTIKADIELLERLLKTYEKNRAPAAG
jgi:BMFP domain-containing protein YqiC